MNVLTRRELDEYEKYVGIYGAKGLAYNIVNDRNKGLDGLQSPILKFLPEPVILAILELVQAETGDIVFFGAAETSIVNAALGALRLKLGADLNLYTSEWQPLWVIDFPMLSEMKLLVVVTSTHHPFYCT